MSELTNGELLALIAAAKHLLKIGQIQNAPKVDPWLETAKVKLEAELEKRI